MHPARKRNRLSNYDYGRPGAYFVTICTKNREHVLGTIVGADDHIGPYVKFSDMGKVVEQYTRSISGLDRYVIMPDHVHMILWVSAENMLEGPVWNEAPVRIGIEKTLRSWKTLISKKLGKGIWQRSYFDHVIRSEQDYWEIVRYIEENPAKWYFQHNNP